MSTRSVLPRLCEGCYLGGMAALNLPLPEGTGDWHMWQTFFRFQKRRSRSFICGPGCLTNTNMFFGLEGIYDCTSTLDLLRIPYECSPVYAADHTRAVSDLVLDAVLQGSSPDFVVLDDWMPRDTDKIKVFELLYKSYPYLSECDCSALRQWEVENRRNFDVC